MHHSTHSTGLWILKRYTYLLFLFGMIGYTFLSGCTKPHHSKVETVFSFPSPEPHGVVSATVLEAMLTAELYGQRGAYAHSLQLYIELAHQHRHPSIIERASEVAIFIRDISSMQEIAKLWLSVEPQSYKSSLYATITELWSENEDDARMHFFRYWDLSTDPHRQELEDFVRAIQKPQHRSVVLDIFMELTQKHPKKSDVFYFSFYVAQHFGYARQAMDFLEQAILLAPDDSKLMQNYAVLSVAHGWGKRALVFTENALEQYPASKPLRRYYIDLLLRNGEVSEVAQQYQYLISTDPQDTTIHTAYAIFLFDQKFFSRSKQQFLILQENSESDVQSISQYYLGLIAETRKQYTKALDWYERIGQPSKYFVEAQIRASIVMAKLKQYEAALASLDTLVPGNRTQRQRIEESRVSIYIEEQRYEDAMASYDVLIASTSPEEAVTWIYGRAMLAEKIGMIAITERDLRQLLMIDPNNAETLNALGFTLADRTERYQEAYQLIEKAYAIKPDEPHIIDSLGWVHYRLGNLDEALQYLEKAANLDPQPEIIAHLAEVLWKKGDTQRAEAILEKASQDYPDDVYLLKARRLIASP